MKGAIDWFTKNHVAANFLMLVVLIVGGATWFGLRKEIFPETSVDTVLIQVPYPNASPEEVEKGILLPIEEAIEGLDGIDRIQSTAAQNIGTVAISALSGTTVRDLLGDVKTRVDAITSFAEEAEAPIIEELVLKGQVLNIAVSAHTDESTLRELAETVREALLAYETEKGTSISQVELAGFRPYEVAVEVSESRLRELGMTLGEVAFAIRASSLDLPAGSIKTQSGEVVIRTEAKQYDAEGFKAITLRTRPDGSRILVGDVAEVIDGFEEVDLANRFDGRPTLLVKVFRTGDEDTLELAGVVDEFLENEAPRLLPEGVELEVWADESVFLEGRLKLLGKNGLVGLLLVFVVLAMFLRPTLALLVSIGIPVSFAGAVMLMPTTGISINMISLFAFILVLGIVVDDAIVVAENVYRRMREGEHPRDAAPKGTHEVGVVVIFGVITTMVAFTPMLGLSGVSGKIWPNIPLIVIPTLMFSLLQSKLILPSHLACLRPSHPDEVPGPIMRFQGIFARGMESFVDRFYRPVLRMVLHARWVTLATFIAGLVAVMGFVGSGWIKFQFFPEVEADIVSAKLQMPSGIPYAETQRAVLQIEGAAMQIREEMEARDGSSIVAHMLSSAGSQPFQSGFDQLAGVPTASNLGEVTIELVPAADRDVTAAEITSRWRELAGAIPGALELSFQTQSAGGGNAIDLEITGTDVGELEAAAAMVKDALAERAGVIDISSSDRAGKRQLRLSILPQGEALGLRLADVTRQVRQGFYGEEVQRLQRGRDEVKVMVRYPRAERETLANLDTMKIRLPDGTEVPFSEVATREWGRSYAVIQRADGRRAVTITADVDKTTGANSNEIVASLVEDVLPEVVSIYPGVSFGFQGEQKDQAQSVQEIFRGMILALLVMYVLMAIPLKSYPQPLIVMSVIPFGMVGAVLGHILMKTELSIMSMCGIVALAGVVVNDSLVLVDYVNRQRSRGIPLVEAAWEAGAARFRPILLTSLTTFAGLTPMLLETDMQARFLIPMAISLGFGILFATAITLILVPSVYLILHDLLGIIYRVFGMEAKADWEVKE